MVKDEFREATLEALGRLPHSDLDGLSDEAAYWYRYQDQIRKELLDCNLDGFLRGTRIEGTMAPRNAPRFHHEFTTLQKQPDWQSRWYPAIREVPVGKPVPHVHCEETSPNAIHQAYHLLQFELTTGKQISDLQFIFEFGGGYGCLCRIAHKLGFQGRYTIYDLPVLSLLQWYYLGTVGIGGVDLITDISSLKVSLEQIPDESLFVAIWSLCEVDMPLRRKIERLVAEFPTFLLAYHRSMLGIDNIAYFDGFARRHDRDWTKWRVKHLRAHYYLIGRQNDSDIQTLD